VVRQDQRASRADLEARTNVDTALFQFGNFGQQVVNVEHDAIADIALHTITHDARRHQVQLVDLLANHQRMAGIMAALKTHHPLA
jgi:hypothetical protein